MATPAPGGRISNQVVDEETSRLSVTWHKPETTRHDDELGQVLTSNQLEEIDLLDRAQLAFVIDFCVRSRSLSEAGRSLLAPLALASRFQTMRIGSANTSVALVWSSRRSKIGRPDLSNRNGGRFRARRYHAVYQQQEPPEQCELWTRHLKQTPARSLAAGITLGKGLTEERILECIVSLPRYIQNLSESGLLMKMV
jgi:hypothetical protein